MHKLPSVAIIIPCYNAGAALEETLSCSAVHSPLVSERVVVNDGSTDPLTIQILACAPERGWKVLSTQNLGAAHARNTGAQEVVSPYLLFLDADDKIDSTFVETTVRALQQHPEYAFAYGHTQLFGTREGLWKRPDVSRPYRLLWDNELPMPALIRREVFLEVGGYAEDLRIHEDWDFWIRLSARGYRGVRADGAVSWYRIDPSSKFQRSLSNRRENVACIHARHQTLLADQPLLEQWRLEEGTSRWFPLLCRIRDVWRESSWIPSWVRSLARPLHRGWNHVAWREVPFYQTCGKRLLDVLFSVLLMITLSPILVACALLIFFTDGLPVIYHQQRVGKHGKLFTLLKFRSMRLDAEVHGPQWAVADDPRETPVGRWLRRTSLDELPQLWNILRGDMSFIGPRPERLVFIDQIQTIAPGFTERLAIRPGLTGLAQVSMRGPATLEQMPRKLSYDLVYIQTCSLQVDLWIVWRTFLTILRRHDH